MSREGLFNWLSEDTLRYNEPLAAHTTFAIGGPCDIWIAPKDRETLSRVLKQCHEEALPVFVLGKGSNLLVSDDGIDGVVLSLENLQDIRIEGNTLQCEAGISLESLCDQAAEAGLGGLAFACGIPGTLGGAVYMNAGAYGGEMKDVITEVEVMDMRGNSSVLSAEEMDFTYRHSRLKDEPLLCVSATLRLVPRDSQEIRQEMDELMAERRAKQPLDYPSAGSTFKRPPGYYAGKLIKEAGMQGQQVGDAQVSMQHAGFIVNRGKATAQDVARLIHKVQGAVKAKAGVCLEPEVRFVGRWKDPYH